MVDILAYAGFVVFIIVLLHYLQSGIDPEHPTSQADSKHDC